MPVGAFGGRAEIMNQLSPEGPVYQAGTLSGNPVAMAAGNAALQKLMQNPRIIDILSQRAQRLMEGLSDTCKKYNIPCQTTVRGSMFGFFFNENEVKNFADAAKTDAELFAKFHQAMLEEGFYFACSLYETGFISTAITDEMIEQTIQAFETVLGKLSGK
jgi:glutamate-1-semialdehyde 2,1-aminomutase